MADHEQIVAAVHHLRKKLCTDPPPEPHKIIRILQKLDDLPITVNVLQETGIGKIVNKLRKQGGEITDAVKGLILSWKELVREAMEAEQQRSQPSPDTSPPAKEASDDEEDSEEEEDEESNDDDDASSQEASSSDEYDSQDGQDAHNSPLASPPHRHQQASRKHLSSDAKSKFDLGYATQDQERTSQKRAHQAAPLHLPESPRKNLQGSPFKKKKVEGGSVVNNSSSQKSSPSMEDKSFSQSLFQGTNLSSNSPSKTPYHKGGKELKHSSKTLAQVDKRKGQSLKSCAIKGSSSKSVDKLQKAGSKGGDNRTSSRTDDVVNGNLKQSVKSSEVKDIVAEKQATSSDSKESLKSSVSSPSKLITSSHSPSKKSTPSQSLKKTSTISKEPPSLTSSTKPLSSVSSALQKKPSSASTVKASKSSKSSVAASEQDNMKPDRINEAAVSKSTKIKATSSMPKDSKSVSTAKRKSKFPDHAESEYDRGEKSPAESNKRRRMSSAGHSTDDDTQSFHTTGLSFGDCLLGPQPKMKKAVKRVPLNSLESSKKVPAVDKASTKSKSSSSTSKVLVSSSLSKGASSNSHSNLQSTKVSKTGNRSLKESSGKVEQSSKSKSSDARKGENTGGGKVRKVEERAYLGSSAHRFLHGQDKSLEESHSEIVFNLPEISADYKPLRLPDLSPKKKMSSAGHEGAYIGSKNTKTKVFSGRVKSSYTSVPSLYSVCMRVLLDNIDALDEVGVPYDIIKPVLEKCTPQQLIRLEDYNPYLLEDTDSLWHQHADRDFKKDRPKELESWRELYLRKMDEREERLKKITSNISASMAKKDPVRVTKMAFVNGPAKPPRNVQRKQARHGTGLITVKPESNPHKPYVPSKHAGDHGPISSSSSSTVRSGGGGGGTSGVSSGESSRENPSYSSISVSGSNGGTSTARRAKTVGPLMQRALKMKKMFRKR